MVSLLCSYEGIGEIFGGDRLKKETPFRSKTSQTSAAADREESDLLLVLNMTNAFRHPNLDFTIMPRSFHVFCEQLK